MTGFNILHCIIAIETERKNIMLPNDPVILLSFINTKLRDEYTSLDELCKSLCISPEDIEFKLSTIGYTYNKEKNRFM